MATFDTETERVINEAAERAVGIYLEKTKDDFQKVFEATDFIKEQLDRKPNREEFDGLKSDVATFKTAVRDTNRDLRQTNQGLRQHRRQTDRRLVKLENAVFHG